MMDCKYSVHERGRGKREGGRTAGLKTLCSYAFSDGAPSVELLHQQHNRYSHVLVKPDGNTSRKGRRTRNELSADPQTQPD